MFCFNQLFAWLCGNLKNLDLIFFRVETDTLKEENFRLQEQLTNVKSKTIQLQNVAIEYSGAKSENSRLKTIIEKQQDKIAECDKEMLIHKDHVDELERVIQKIQDEKNTPVCFFDEM